MNEFKLELDPEVNPEFKTYSKVFDSKYGNGTEVACCVDTNTFIIEQFSHDEQDESDIIILDRSELYKLKTLVDQAVKLFEENA